MDTCCHTEHDGHDHNENKIDYILYASLLIIGLSYLAYALGIQQPHLVHFVHTVTEFLSTMWWGVVLGIVFVGLMNKIPREYFQVLLGPGDKPGGIFRAALAGLLLDMCSHGILMVGAKLYERGASAAQVMTFLIASPWNSISLTIILITLIGLKWTLLFIGLSALIAVLSGFVFMALTRAGVLPENPNKPEIPENFSIKEDARTRLKNFRLSPRFVKEIILGGLPEARMLLRWLLLGVIIAASVRTFIPADTFATWFGPTMLGLAMTLISATIIEVCSEGSAPIASEILNNAAAPGNAFTFLMAGVATDYTEILVLKDTTRSWKIALFLPLVTVPQTLLIGYLMNVFQ